MSLPKLEWAALIFSNAYAHNTNGKICEMFICSSLIGTFILVEESRGIKNKGKQGMIPFYVHVRFDNHFYISWTHYQESFLGIVWDGGEIRVTKKAKVIDFGT